MDHQCSCGDAHDATELGVKYSLHEKIDRNRLECLNENTEGSGVQVFKTWENRLSTSEVNNEEKKKICFMYSKLYHVFVVRSLQSFIIFTSFYFSTSRVI